MNNKIICTSIISDDDISNMYLIKRSLKSEVTNILISNNTLNFDFSENTSIFFKMLLGNYIECINSGYNIIFYKYSNKNKYYYKLHKLILSGLGYDYKLYDVSFKSLKVINTKLNIFCYLHYLMLSKFIKLLLRKHEKYIRNNISFEVNKGSFERVKKTMINRYLESKNIISILKNYIRYKKRFKEIFIDKPRSCLKIAIIGDLFSSYIIERHLESKNIEVYKIYKRNKLKMYDGVIYIRDFYNSNETGFLKSFECLCNKQKKPLLYLNIDENVSEDNIKLKLDIFYDVITLKTY